MSSSTGRRLEGILQELVLSVIRLLGTNLGCQAWQQVLPPLSQNLVLTFRGNGFSSFVTCALDDFLLWQAVLWGL